MKKVYPDAKAALAGVLKDGMLIMAGGFGLCGIPETLIHAIGRSLRITSPLIVTPWATASSRASPTSRPELLVPSPETSMVRRGDS